MSDYSGKKVKIINTNGFNSNKFKYLNQYIGKTGIIKNDYGEYFRFVINFFDKEISEIDCANGTLNFQLCNIEFVEDGKEKEMEGKPPLGVMPEYIYEVKRIQDLSRALHEYSEYNPTKLNCKNMMDWTQELYARLEKVYLNKSATL